MKKNMIKASKNQVSGNNIKSIKLDSSTIPVKMLNNFISKNKLTFFLTFSPEKDSSTTTQLKQQQRTDQFKKYKN